MSYTREQMIEAYVAGMRRHTMGPLDTPQRVAERYVATVVGSEGLPRQYKNFSDAPHSKPFAPLAVKAPPCDQIPSSYLPPVGTPEEVLARSVASLMCRTFMALAGDVEPATVFNAEWYWPTMDALRSAYPILGAVEDAREEVKA